jgi:hypothetical protein
LFCAAAIVGWSMPAASAALLLMMSQLPVVTWMLVAAR